MLTPTRIFEQSLAVLPAGRRYRVERYLRGWFDQRRLGRADYAVVSFGKSGRTWVRVMLSRLCQLEYGLPERELLEFDNYHRANPAIPRIFFTHDNYLRDYTGHGGSKRAYREQRVVLLVRHPADVTMSQYFQWKHRMRSHKILLNQYPADPATSQFEFMMGPSGLPKVIDFLNEWAAGFAEVRSGLTVRYEDLRTDTARELGRLAGFLGLDVDAARLADVVEYASVENMRQREREEQSGSERLRPGDPSNPDSFKTRRAKVGGYHDYFDAAGIAEIDALIARTLDPVFGY
ncbi:MAG: sulfotransferase domain-containing protein [Pseudomonadales bacterium]|nr:sulfotransferase domain-containing protein [Pseudomonadales bacterium]